MRPQNIIPQACYEIQYDKHQQMFLNYKRLNNIKESTIKTYNTAFNSLINNNIAPLRYNDIEKLEEQIMEFFLKINHLEGGYNKIRIRLNSYFNWCVEKEIIEYNPIKKLGIKPKKDLALPRPANVNSLKKLLKSINIKTYAGFRDYCYILLAIDTGIRPNEAIQLNWENIDFKNQELTVTAEIAKTNKQRILPVSSLVMQNLSELKNLDSLFTICDNGVFKTQYGVKFSGSHLFQRNFKRYCKEYNIEPEITPYMLRHYFATYYLINNGNLLYLQYIMGHSDISTTKKYVKINENIVREEHNQSTPLKNVISRNTKVINIFKN